MKNILFTIIILFFGYGAWSQTGLIAHWNMNGNTNDSSGNGHNGHGNNLTPAIGKDGVMGHAWYFNGVNSSITIPYSPALNVNSYTIAATIKVQGFYSGPCLENIIFTRGTTNVSSGIYHLQFNDFPAGATCSSAPDTAIECFVTVACSNTASLGGSWPSYNYTPHVAENVWYNVVGTFNDTVFKIYVNNVLMSTITSSTPGVPIGTSTDSASIGYDTYQAGAGDTYAFKGVIDDIKLFNRALSDSEAVHLTTEVDIVNAKEIISVYPNPATKELTVSAANLVKTISINNMVGQTIFSNEYNAENINVNVADIPSGVYFIRVNGTEVRRFVKE